MKNKFYIEIEHSWGLGNPPGCFKVIVENDGLVTTSFKKYNLKKQEESKTDIKQISKLSYFKMFKLKRFFIKENIFEKQYNESQIMDASWNILIRFGNKEIEIKNELKLYDKIYSKIEKYIGQKLYQK